MTEEQAKKIKKKDKESSELKGELTEDELKGVPGGVGISDILPEVGGLVDP